jgi:ferredoxin-NADP reductase
VLREVWSGFFYRSVEFYAKGDELAVVNCVKNPITDALGMHKVGQYYFINFPSISYSEWHPFSVSNGPRETDIEFHIRDLGDWTHDVCQKAIQASQNPTLPKPYCRIDGPYGVHDFDCRRYPRMMLVGGGVGITPVMGILKDIYNVGKFSDSERYRVLPHIVDTVFAVWVCRYREDADWFLKDLELCAQNSMLPQFPKLQTWIYITRGQNLDAPLISGRPEFADIFRELDTSVNQDQVRKITKAATFVFSCGPGAMVNELWDLSMNRTLDGLRTDFHHETFDF